MKTFDLEQANVEYWVLSMEDSIGKLKFIDKETVEPRAGIEIHTTRDPLRALKLPDKDYATKFLKLIRKHCASYSRIYLHHVRLNLEVIETIVN